MLETRRLGLFGCKHVWLFGCTCRVRVDYGPDLLLSRLLDILISFSMMILFSFNRLAQDTKKPRTMPGLRL